MRQRRSAHWFVVSLLLIMNASRCEALNPGVVTTITVQVVNHLKEIIQSFGAACLEVKAVTDGPDGDDSGGDATSDCDDGLEWFLGEETGLVSGYNAEDNGTEKPYTPGDPHNASIELRYSAPFGGAWAFESFNGWVKAEPDDDPTANAQKTYAAASAAFSADGKTFDACFEAATQEGGHFTDVQKAPCPSQGLADSEDLPLPEMRLLHAGLFLAEPDRFTFTNLAGDQVLIQPSIETVDLLHTYLQQPENLSILPLLRGHDPIVQELKRDAYANRVAGRGWTLSESPGEKADLTIVGLALHFASLTLPRAGRTDSALLEAYFASNAVSVVAPEHAQAGYVPRVVFREVVHSGQDISALLGMPFVIPQDGKPSEPGPPVPGLIVGIEGDLNEAVALAVNTEGNFVRDIARRAWDGTSQSSRFRVPGSNFHDESASALSDVAVASPEETDDEPPTCELTFSYPGPPAYIEVTVQDVGSGLGSIEVLKQENADVPIPPFSPGTLDAVVVTATKINEKQRSRVELKAVDMAGNSKTCDPVLTSLLISRRGKPVRQSFANLPAAESLVTIHNGDPGIAHLEVVVNGTPFVARRLGNRQVGNLDVSSAMLPGDVNIITLRAFGEPGASAMVLIHD